MAARIELHFEPLGDQAVLARAADETTALAFANAARQAGRTWIEDVVQAYTTVAVFYRFGEVEYEQATKQLAALDWQSHVAEATGNLHVVPCCYDLGLDFDRIAKHTGLTRDQIIAAHTGTTYTVYAIGFCPGFPYLGYLPPELSGVPRLEAPRLKLDAGSVGLTGRQTGIYTESRPGGWNIVGRTPLELVNVAEGYFPIRTGDRVRFQAIGEREFRKLSGQRLSV